MRQLKRLFSNVVVVLVAFAQILPSATTMAVAETNPALKVQVVGEGSVTVSQDTTSYYVDSSEDFEEVFEEGTELHFDVLSDTGIKSITENGQTLVDAQNQALNDYLDNTDYQFDYKTSSEDKTIVITFNESETTDDSSSSQTTEETKDDSSSQSSSETKEESKDTTSEKKDVKKSDTLNIDTSRVEMTEEEQAILNDQINGKYDEHKEDRKAKAYTSGLWKYCDDDYFLTKKYYKTYDGNMLSFDGLRILDPYACGRKSGTIDLGSTEASKKTRDGGLTVTSLKEMVWRNYNTGYVIYNGEWTLSNGKTAYCATGNNASPEAGDTTSSPQVIDKAELRKALYYGAQGPQSQVMRNYIISLGISTVDGAMVVATDDLVSYAYCGTSIGIASSGGHWWNEYIGNIWNYIQSQPDPEGFTVYGVQVNGSAENWQHQTTAKQFLVYGEYNPKGKASILKTSANADITKDNDCYSLKGAEYGVYSDSDCNNKVATLTTDEDGKSEEVELDAGTYYVKELDAPKGYALDETVHTLEVKAGETNKLELQDTPQSDPVGILLKKKDSSSKDGNAQATASLEGAEFTVKYYDVQSDTDPAQDGQEADRTWVLKTDSDGYCRLSSDWLVSGDEFYTNDGQTSLPLGTITIQETKAPEGYNIDDTVFVRQITAEGSAETVNTYNEPTIKDDVLTGRFAITKFMTDGEKSEQVEPEVGAEFTAVLEKYYTEADGDMEKALALAKANGNEKEYSVLKTDKQGEASSGELAYGTYIVKQTKVGSNGEETWELDETFKFVVSEQDTKAYVYGELADGREVTASEDGLVHYYINNIPVTSGVKLIKKDADTGKTVSLNSASFKIKKLKDGEAVKNYKKKTVRTDENGYVSVKVGSKWYDTFTTNSDNRVSVAGYEASSDEEKGTVTLPVALPSGDYQVVETNAPSGYLKGSTDGKFTISKSKITGTDDDGQPILSYVFSDPKPTGKVTLKKTFDSDVRLHGTVTFKLIATQDILDPATGEIQYAKNSIVGTYDLGEDDTITIENLPLGTGESAFKLVEASTYENYKLSTKETAVSFKQKDQTTTQYTETVKAENETIKIGTKALNAKTNEKYFNSAKEITVTDVVSYDGLTKGQSYTMHATLIDKSTGEAVTNADGTVVEGVKKFTADDESGEVKVKMTLDASQLGGKDYVVYESLYNTGSQGHESCEIASHKDINDEGQTITIKKCEIGTTATTENGTHEQQVTDGKVTLNDKVSYKNLVKGVKYVVKGVLMDKSTGEAFKDTDGKKVTSEATFTAEDTKGSVNVEFKFDASQVTANTKLVVYETLYEVDDTDGVDKKIEVTDHKDSNDEGQTINFIDVHTNATSENGSDETQATDDTIKLTDTVSYEGLTVGKEYTVKGVLMNQETGEELLDSDGNKITAETTFTPETSDGTVDVEFEFNGKGIEAGTNVVVFEDLYRDGIKVATHSDIEDENQTIDIIDLKTTAISDKGNNTALSGVSEVTITDIVKYTNLHVGQEYTVKGVLMNKETGEKMLDADGNEITGETTFTPEEKDGAVEVEFKMNSSIFTDKVVVVFEDLYRDDIQVATHSDLNDKDQTIRFKNFHVKVNKIDSNTQKNITSEKFEFTMYSDKDCTQAVKTVAGNTETGVAEFEVEEGTWYIKETKAPNGYKISNEAIKVEVKNKTLYINDEAKDTDDEYVASIVFANSMIPTETTKTKTTKTGTGTGLTLFTVLGLCSLALIVLIQFYRKKFAKAE